MIMINFKHHLIIIKKWDLGAKSAEVFRPPQTAAIQDSSTPSDSARQDASGTLLSHEIRRREGRQRSPSR